MCGPIIKILPNRSQWPRSMRREDVRSSQAKILKTVHDHIAILPEDSIESPYGNILERSHLAQHLRELSGRVHDSRPKGRGFKPQRRHCVLVLEQDTFILA